MAKFDKLMERLQNHPGCITERYNIHADVLRSPSPSVNNTFGNGWGLPRGYTAVIWGPPKGGKSVLIHNFISQLHADDPDAVAAVFSTEMREQGQMSLVQMGKIGIDPKRYLAYETNRPEEIFDFIADEKEGIYGMVKEGLPVKLVVIDSTNSILGVREETQTTMNKNQIGDGALTVQKGLKWMLAAQRRGNFALIVTSQARAEMDQAEQMRGKTTRMAGAFGLQHFCEYFLYLEPNRNKAGRTNLLEEEYVDENVKDINDHPEKTAHRIKLTMQDSSLGPKGRTAEFTLDHDTLRVINVYEEVFKLGVARGIIEKPNQVTYIVKDKKFGGKGAILQALRDDFDLQAAIVKELREQDFKSAVTVVG